MVRSLPIREGQRDAIVSKEKTRHFLEMYQKMRLGKQMGSH